MTNQLFIIKCSKIDLYYLYICLSDFGTKNLKCSKVVQNIYINEITTLEHFKEIAKYIIIY
jgi:hypothetical protein